MFDLLKKAKIETRKDHIKQINTNPYVNIIFEIRPMKGIISQCQRRLIKELNLRS